MFFVYLSANTFGDYVDSTAVYHNTFRALNPNRKSSGFDPVFTVFLLSYYCVCAKVFFLRFSSIYFFADIQCQKSKYEANEKKELRENCDKMMAMFWKIFIAFGNKRTDRNIV